MPIGGLSTQNIAAWRGDVWHDWAASGSIKRSMLYHSVEIALDFFHTQKEINNSSQ
jgi:hypothetical protein